MNGSRSFRGGLEKGLYGIYYKHDNGGRIYFQGVLSASNWVDTVSEEFFTITLVTGTKYKVVAEFFNTGGPAQSYLSWAYTGQAKIIVPSNYLSYKGLTSSSPFSVIVNPSWGNGIRTSNEFWDDGNTVNDDGWSNNWIVEQYWTCAGGSLVSKDIWSCNKPITPSPLPSSTSESSNPNMDAYTYLFLGMLALGSLSNFMSSVLSQGCIQSIFNFINQVQLILLLPMLWSAMPKLLVNFIASLNLCLLNFGVAFGDSPSMNSFFTLDYDQPNEYLSKIKLKSGSWLVNLTGVFYTILIIILLHIFITFLRSWLKWNNNEIFFHKMLNVCFLFFTFGFYIQQFMNSLLVMLISSCSEFGRHEFTTTKKSISFSFSIGIYIFWVSFIFWAAYKWWSSRRFIEEITYSKQLFDGVKPFNKARFNVMRFLLQRLIFWMIASLWGDEGYYFKIALYWIFETWWFFLHNNSKTFQRV